MEINWKTEKKQIMVEKTVSVVDSITLSSKECEILSVLAQFNDQVVEAIKDYINGTPLTEYVPDTSVELSDIHDFLSECLILDMRHNDADIITKDLITANLVIDAQNDKPIIDVGDMVKVVRKASPVGWDTHWVPEMDRHIGDTLEVIEISESSGYRLDAGADWWWFPLESLKKVA